MSARPPLPTLLSQVLVAFTIELDNEAERRFGAPGSRPWLTSLAMWSNYLRFLGEETLRVGELQTVAGVSRADIDSRLAAFERWGYVVVVPDRQDGSSPSRRRDRMVRLTPAGRRAHEVWRGLPESIVLRWRERFGNDTIERLRGSLETRLSRLGLELPRYLPVVSYGDGMFAWVPDFQGLVPAGGARRAASRLDLSALLSQVLLVFTIEFERESILSLTMSANITRVLDERGVRVRDLPRLSGVSKEAVSASVGFLERRGYTVVEPDPSASRTKLARLTPKGQEAQGAYRRLLSVVEERWRTRLGGEVESVGASLLELVDQREGDRPRLSEGLLPPPGGWRARKPYLTQTMAMVRDPTGALPHHPMVLHRGGFPDGS